MRLINFQTVYKVCGWLLISVLPLTAVGCHNLLPAWLFMWILAFAIYLSLKGLTWWRARSRIAHPAWRSVAYLLAWPGMDADAFLDAREHLSPPAPSTWLWATFEAILGAILLWVVARSVPQGKSLLRGWIGMLGLILILHYASLQGGDLPSQGSSCYECIFRVFHGIAGFRQRNDRSLSIYCKVTKRLRRILNKTPRIFGGARNSSVGSRA